MKVLVLGANGMAGHIITRYFIKEGFDVVGLTRIPITYCKNIVIDVRDKDVLKQHFIMNNYDVVINCIGVLNTRVDKDIAQGIFINSFFPHFLVDCFKSSSTRIIHLSTDCVFSGKKGLYNEQDIKDAYSLYGITKSLGEINDSRNLTIRTSIIGPDQSHEGIGLFNWFMNQEKSIKGFVTAKWSGVTTIVMAKAIVEAVNQGITGLYHLVNNNSISKYELLLLFNKYVKKTPIDIISSNELVIDKTLVNNRNDFNFLVPSYKEMVIEMSNWINDHKSIYRHYSS